MASCENCHRQMDVGWMAGHVQAYGDSCLACHDGVDRFGCSFVHPAGFPLDGKHAAIDCEECHRRARTLADFKVSSASCVSCHQREDPHQGRFGTNCETCHTTAGWTPATFDHNLSRFPLTGAHTRVKCESCHQKRVFKGTPTECVACHREPAFHMGMFPGQTCFECHTTNAWRPAKYDGPHAFPMNHGERVGRPNTCASCHQPTLAEWTCYTCHNQAKIAREHREEGITNFKDCLHCHPTGREDEGGEEED